MTLDCFRDGVKRCVVSMTTSWHDEMGESKPSPPRPRWRRGRAPRSGRAFGVDALRLVAWPKEVYSAPAGIIFYQSVKQDG